MKNILTKLKKILDRFFLKNKKDEVNKCADDNKTININNINFCLLNELKEYDIVWVKMSDGQIKKGNIDKNHMFRPFLVKEVLYDNMKIRGYYFTSNLNNYGFLNSNQRFKLVVSKDDTNLSKNSLLKYKKFITLPVENIMHYMDHLDDNNIKKLSKLSSIYNKELAYSNFVELGDLIVFDYKNYFIYKSDNQNAYGVEIEKVSPIIYNQEYYYNDYSFMVLDDMKLYKINYKNKRSFKLGENYLIKNLYSLDRVKNFIKYNSEYFYNRKVKRKKK